MVHYTLLTDPVSNRPLMGFITDGRMGTYVGADGADREDMNSRLQFAIAHHEITEPSTVEGWMMLALSNMILAPKHSADVGTVEEARAAVCAALCAAAEAPHDLQLSPQGAMNPRPFTEAIEDYPGPEQPWGAVDPTERHVFAPLSIVNPWDCAYCFASEGALIHTNDMREQVIANYGDPSDELVQYDEYLAQFDVPSDNL